MAADKPSSLTDIVLHTLSDFDQPLSSADIYDRSDAFENNTQIAGILNRLYVDKRVLRTTNAAGRFVYWLKPAVQAQSTAVAVNAEPDEAAPAPHVKRKYTRRAAPAPAVVPVAPVAEPVAPVAPVVVPAPKPSYVLFDHIAHAMHDLDDLVSDALDHGAAAEVVKCVVASQSALRRAQEAIYREARP